MNSIVLQPYETSRNPLSIKLLLMGALLLTLAVAPTGVVVLKQGVSVALVGSGLWLVVLGLVAIYCYRLAMRIPGGFHDLRWEERKLICISTRGEVEIPIETISLVMLDKVIANFVGYEIILLRDVEVIQLAVSTHQRDLHPVFDKLSIWLEAEERPPNPKKQLPRSITPETAQDWSEDKEDAGGSNRDITDTDK